MARYSMLIDLTRCIGCDACTLACKQENGTPMDVFFARVINVEHGRYPNVKRTYIPVLCNHCENPACLKACPNKAIIRREDGIVLIDQDRCRGTGACVSACPYGNIILSDKDAWYLNDDERYETEYLRPRLEPNVARKCTYCAHRVDEGLKPACVVACPTTARIFGDLEDPESDVSRYIVEQEEQTNRIPFKLLPEAGTRPAGMYLGPMSEQKVEVVEKEPKPSPGIREPSSDGVPIKTLVTLIAALAIGLSSARAQTPGGKIELKTADYASSSCVGCHGQTAMGGLGPPLASTKLTYEQFIKTVRNGKSMMPAIPQTEVSDAEAQALFSEVKSKPWNETQIPLAYRIGSMLTTQNVAIFFMVVTLFALIFSVRVIAYYLGCAGLNKLWPSIRKFGFLKAFGVFCWSLFVDGFLVSSLWRSNKFRWFMHGLILYGFFGLMLADMLIQINNPARAQMDLFSPIKLLALTSGIAVIIGLSYVLIRYRRDQYIDNGITLGRDFLFVSLLLNAIVSGFLTVILKRGTAHDWVMPVYIWHLLSVGLLIGTAPFTRFQHAFVVPIMAAMTRLTAAIAQSGLEIGFIREPSPGRHHKTQRIAEQVVSIIDSKAKDEVVLRYYP